MHTVQQMAGPQTMPFRPQQYQYGTVSGYYPTQTTTDPMTSMMQMMMPMIMMIMMFSIMGPLLKGTSKS